ncbi:Ribonuclease H [Handroanthus impetiginosus]|uniref:Ribonuclease H n=1 Tax=Handroanthus impetiginosus TaxID=429701 RepID=A0A2G9I918_9LAMI|nr:Ribonuclease H [Handroanthus impetiginosus]
MSRPVLSGRLAKWSIIFNQYEITYVSQKAVKGQVLANFLADHPIPSELELSYEFSYEDVLFIEILPAWMMLFDGAARSDGTGAGVVFVSPEKQVLTYSIVLNELCFNNIAEYQTLIIEFQMAQEMGIAELEVYGNSKFVINQLLNVYKVKKDDFVPYFQQASKFDHENTNAVSVSVSDDKDWRTPLIDYLKEGKPPQDPRHRTEMR